MEYKKDSFRGSNSVVECQLPKLKVAGSNPVSRSIVTRIAKFYWDTLRDTFAEVLKGCPKALRDF